tara:strand:+ start:814 stop:1197 length:384 start_codon:yes stop_codon:yes gene_type:complete
MPNSFDVNKKERLVATPRPGRNNKGRHFRTWQAGSAFAIKQFSDIAGRTKTCMVQIKSNEDGTGKQELLMTIDGTDPQGTSLPFTGHVLGERQIYYFDQALIKKAKFANIPSQQTKQIILVVTELTV